jgi:hypothetical protein
MSLLSQLSDRNLRLRLPFLRVGTAADRLFERYDCYLISTMSIVDRALMLDGIVDSISRGGLQFHPASAYILDRRGERVSIAVGHRNLEGKIVAVRHSGYGVALDEPLGTVELAEIVREFG